MGKLSRIATARRIRAVAILPLFARSANFLIAIFCRFGNQRPSLTTKDTKSTKFRKKNFIQILRVSPRLIRLWRNLVRDLRGDICRFLAWLWCDHVDKGIAQSFPPLILFLTSFLSGCSPTYVWRAAYEEGKILWRRQPIVDYLQSPDVHSDVKEKLQLVLLVREYARDVLELNVGGSYSSFSYVDRPDLTYVLTAAPKTELTPYTWWFLIIGRVPYRGFFTKESAQAAAEKLQADGYDTNIRPSAAFSTLGWFDDPLLAHLLKYDKVTLADLVFHELFHNTLYVKGAGSFNESSANFVGGRAAIEFFRDKFGEGSAEHQRAVDRWQEELEFSDFIETCANSLRELYARDIPDEEKVRLREEIFHRAQKEWQARIALRQAPRFRAFATQPLNNAIMIHYLLYFQELKLFEALYDSEGRNLVKTIRAIQQAVKKDGEPFAAVRKLLEKRKS